MRKYRTKSGKVEEKLPGIDATVSKSEKVQIAMAGGADTLKAVRDILGHEGKRNNLKKGQGAKHLVSFAYGDPDDSYGIGDLGEFDSGPSGTSNIGGLDVSGGMAESVMGSSLGFGEPDDGGYDDEAGGRESTEETIRTGIRQAQQNTLISPQEQYERGRSFLEVAKANVARAIPGLTTVLTAYDEEVGKPPKTVTSPFNLAGTALGLPFGLSGPLGVAGSSIDTYNRAQDRAQKTSDEIAQSRIEGKEEGLVSETNPFGAFNPPPAPPPDDLGSNRGNIPKKMKKPRTPSNNVTLAVSEKKDKRATRAQSRYRGGWRFA